MIQKFSLTIQNLNGLSEIIEEMKPFFKPHTLILIDGDLGAGKTTLTAGLLKSLGCDHVSSPTYALHQSYPIVIEQHRLSVEHLDLYRLENEDEIESSGIWDLFSNRKNIIVVEWPHRVSLDQWPLDWDKYLVKITRTENGRTYQIYSF